MPDEPVAREFGHAFQGARLFEEMAGSRDDGKLVLAAEIRERLSVYALASFYRSTVPVARHPVRTSNVGRR